MRQTIAPRPELGVYADAVAQFDILGRARREAGMLRAEVDHMVRWALAYTEHAARLEALPPRFDALKPRSPFDWLRYLVDQLEATGYDPWTKYDEAAHDGPRPSIDSDERRQRAA